MTESDQATTETIRNALLMAIEKSRRTDWMKELSNFESEFKQAKNSGVPMKTLVDTLKTSGFKAPKNVVLDYLVRTIGFKVSKRQLKFKEKQTSV